MRYAALFFPPDPLPGVLDRITLPRPPWVKDPRG